MNKDVFRILSWSLLIGAAIFSIVIGIFLGENNITAEMVIRAKSPGPMANWFFFFIAISVGLSVYVIRGIEGGIWKVSIKSIFTLVGAATLLLLFGVEGLMALGLVSLIVTPFIMNHKTNDKKI